MKSPCMIHEFRRANHLLDYSQSFDFIAPLAIRIYLFFPFWIAGTNKLANIEGTAAWFGGALGLPFPEFMAYLAAFTETLGAVALLLGFGVRFVAIPLMITMLVAIFLVHWEHGWHAIASSSDPEIAERLSKARGLLREHGQYDWLTEKGRFVVLQNGIEFGVTYFVMTLSLFFSGSGRYLSIDYWLHRRYMRSSVASESISGS